MQLLSHTSTWPVYKRDSIALLEAQLRADKPISLMQQAGLATAKLALAMAPHAQRIWVAAGPGNNGGDGLEAAMHLHRWGKSVHVSLLVPAANLPADAHAAWLRAQTAGVHITSELPTDWLAEMGQQDLCIDALLGIGAKRPLRPVIQIWVRAINHCKASVLAIDSPTGLDPDSGQLLGGSTEASLCVRADQTLTFIAAKTGLLMGHGRDASGQLWLERLGQPHASTPPPPQALLNTLQALPTKNHASHKGSHGDVAVIGGEAMTAHGLGMTGAAILAAKAALHAGAGRVILSLVSGNFSDSAPPDVMQREWQSLELEKLHVVCGCGGGQGVQSLMPEVLRRSAQLVLDADGLNAVAQDDRLQAGLRQRASAQPSLITPHPLEAARLLKVSTTQVQNDRIGAAQELANRFDCTVVLKGSGTVITAPGQTPRINTTGNGRLAIGGTGDVLAGLIGARLAQGLSTFEAACTAVAQHGQLADDWPPAYALTASRLAERLT
jgi:hydroxyethylthiazole kinase-like uncharacterized protein yjeF